MGRTSQSNLAAFTQDFPVLADKRGMINPISSAASLYVSNPAPLAAPAKQQPVTPPQDTVKLSPAALAALGDTDHDGDAQ